MAHEAFNRKGLLKGERGSLKFNPLVIAKLLPSQACSSSTFSLLLTDEALLEEAARFPSSFSLPILALRDWVSSSSSILPEITWEEALQEEFLLFSG